MARDKSRVAVIGCGYWGKNLVRVFHELGSLAAVCDSSEQSLASCRTLYPDCPTVSSYEELLADPSIDAVAIATPAETHVSVAKAALNAGKDVFVEKPLALDVASGQQLIDLAKRKEAILMVGHLLWYHPAVLKLKECVHAGELGRIQYIYSNRLNLGKIRREENILWSFAPHDLSVILGLLGEMPDYVMAQGGNYLHKQIADVTMSCFSFPSGKQAHIFVSWLHPFKEQKLVVVGEKKMAVFDDLEKENKLKLYPHTIEWKGQVPVVHKADAQNVPLESHEPLRAECEHFLECLRSRKSPRTDGEEALRVLTVMQKCQQALEVPCGTTVAVSAKSLSRAFSAHESAFIDEGTEIGKGTTIWHVSHILKGSKIGQNCRIGQNVVVGPDAVIGDNVKIQNNVSVYQGVTLEDGVFCGPSMVFTNVINPRSEIPRMGEIRKTLVRQGATLGANCTILCGTTVGRYAFVGAGAVVTHDVPDFGLVVGVPARFRGWMCQCGIQLRSNGNKIRCAHCGSQYKKHGKNLVRIVRAKKA